MATIHDPIPIHADLLTNASTGVTQDIADFLAKPYPIQTGTLGVSDTSSTFTPIRVLTNLTDLDLYQSKIKGHLGIRATNVFRLQVNANRFQQGRYIMFWLPYGGTSLTDETNIKHLRLANLTTVTQLPHVEIDLATQTEAVLEVPYLSVFSHHPLVLSNTTTDNLGIVGLYPYSPLVAPTGSTTASYTIFSSLKDVEFAAPTVPQMSFPMQGMDARTKQSPASKMSSRVSRAMFDSNLDDAAAKSRKTTGKKVRSFVGNKNISQQEQDSTGKGPVSTVLGIVSSVASAVGTFVPFLSEIAWPVSWVSDLLAGAANIFGWSNPIDLSPVLRAVQTVFPYANNCDVIDEAMPISLFARNLIEVLPGFAGNDIDEMAIDYIKTIPAWYDTRTFTTSNVIGDSIFHYNLNPSGWNTSFSNGSTTLYCPTPVSFLANMFQYYRGGFRIRVKIVKTEFHSGRLELVFSPYEPAMVPTVTVSSSTKPYVHREVIDLRDGNEFDFMVPYTSLTPYRSTIDSFTYFGFLDCQVLNPLIAPASVSTSISLLVEVAGAPDFEVAVPKNREWYPCVPATPQMDFSPPVQDGTIISGTVGESGHIHDNHLSARACIGEKVMSLLLLTKSTDTIATNLTVNVGNMLLMDPYSIPIASATAASTTKLPDYLPDNYALISSLYLFNRGGVRIRGAYSAYVASPNTDVGSPGLQTSFIVETKLIALTNGSTAYSAMSTPAISTTNNHGMNVVQNLAFRSGFEIQIPQYHQFHSRITSDSWYNANSTVPITIKYADITTSRLQLSVQTPHDYAVNELGYSIRRQASDDFQAGFFLGIPPMTGTYGF